MILLPEFYSELYRFLKLEFAKEWERRGKIAPDGDPAIWKLSVEVTDKKNGRKSQVDVVNQVLKRNEMYFYHHHLDADNGHSVSLRESIAMEVFNYLDCEGRLLEARFEDFCKRYHIDTVLANRQREENFKNIPKRKPKPKLEPVIPHSLQGISAKCRHYLSNTKWWAYFYGYEEAFNMAYDKEINWKLLSLVFTFSDEGQTDLGVHLKNDNNRNHYDYKGTTEFNLSSDIVLVINIRTTLGSTRQMNIKLNVSTVAGDIFIGQYLNYDETGHIFSGTLILEKIDADLFPKPEPYVFNIPRNASKPEDYPDEVRHIAPLLQERRLNFRRSPQNVHSKDEIILWQKRRRERGQQSSIYGGDDLDA